MVISLDEHTPQITGAAFIAPNATIAGNIECGPDCSFWYGVVARGDGAPIRFGARVNVQDLTMVHITSERHGTTVHDDVTIGHRAVLHGCEVGRGALIGIGAIILDGAVIGEESLVGAGALVTPRTQIPPRSLVLGSPAKVVRQLRDEEVAALYDSASHYVKLARKHHLATQGHRS